MNYVPSHTNALSVHVFPFPNTQRSGQTGGAAEDLPGGIY